MRDIKGVIIGNSIMASGTFAFGYFIWSLCRPGLSVLESLGVVAAFYALIAFFCFWIAMPGAGCEKVVIVNKN